MELFPLRARPLLLPMIIALFSFMLLASFYYLPAVEKVASYVGFKHGSTWDLAHGSASPDWDDTAVWREHLSQLAASAKASRPPPTGAAHASTSHTGPACQEVSGATDVLVVLKTGAAEVASKLPTQLSTVLSCIPNYLVVSDLDQNFKGHYIHDALWSISPKWKESQPELTVSDNQKLDRTLDRWKSLPALHLAYTLHPDVSWFAFIDVDTYLSFPNLLQLVKSLDPKEPLYTGYDVGSTGTNLAPKNSGYLISHAAAKLFNENFKNGGEERWEEETAKAENGHEVLRLAMKDSGAPFSGSPGGDIFQDTPIWMFGDWAALWCQPAVSWHGLASLEVEHFWAWERHRVETRGDGVIRFRDVFEGLVEPKIRLGHRAGWQNMAAGKIFTALRANSTKEELRLWESLEEFDVDPTVSWDACEKACQLDRGCLSWQLGSRKCSLENGVRLGRKTEGEVKYHGSAISGWNIERIEHWKEKIGPCT